MENTTQPASWSIDEALAVAYTAFTQRFGVDLLHQAFEALTLKPKQTMDEHRDLEYDLGKYLGYAISAQGAELVIWMANARSRPDNAALLLHCGVRWWLAREDMLRQPAATRFACEYAPGSKDHVSLQLLTQMLYRGSAPDRAPSAVLQAR